MGSKDIGAGCLGFLCEGGSADDSTSTVVVLVMFMLGTNGSEVLADQSTTVSLDPSEGCEAGGMTVPFRRSLLLVELSWSAVENSGSTSDHAPS